MKAVLKSITEGVKESSTDRFSFTIKDNKDGKSVLFDVYVRSTDKKGMGYDIVVPEKGVNEKEGQRIRFEVAINGNHKKEMQSNVIPDKDVLIN